MVAFITGFLTGAVMWFVLFCLAIISEKVKGTEK